MRETNNTDVLALAEVFETFGVHPKVGTSVDTYSIVGDPIEHIRVDVTLRFTSEHRLCCPEPSCYMGFLGWNRFGIPAAVSKALGFPKDTPLILRVQTRHDPGYQYKDFPGPEFSRDQTMIFDDFEKSIR